MTTPSIAEASGRTGFQLTAQRAQEEAAEGRGVAPGSCLQGKSSARHIVRETSSAPDPHPRPIFTAEVPIRLLVLVLPLTLCGALNKGLPFSGPQFPHM